MRLSLTPMRDCPLSLSLAPDTEPLRATGLVEAATRIFELPTPIDPDAPLLIEVNGAPVPASVREANTVEVHRAPLDRGDIVAVWYAQAS